MRHRFYLPIGMPNLPSPPAGPEDGETYFDTYLKKLRTWDGTKWISGGGTLAAGAGLSGGGSTADDIAINVNTGYGLTITGDEVTIDPTYTTGIQDQINSALPTGMISMWAGATAPTGWAICDGITRHNSPALKVILGSDFTPDLKDRFIVGTGGSYSVGQVGGEAAVQLTSAQSGQVGHNHDHTAHYHDGQTWGMNRSNPHNHGGPQLFALTNGVMATPGGTDSYAAISGWVDSVDATDINHEHPFITGWAAGTNVPVGDRGADAPHENRPPFYALMYVIKT